MTIEFRAITKTFGSIKANDAISLSVPPATIQGVLGENGAGKSTLMKIFSGFLGPDSGEIVFDGKPVGIASPNDAIRLGIGMLHQDPLDFPPFKIIDDFMLGSPGGLVPDRRKALADFSALSARFDFSLSPEARVSSLTVGERQQLEILRLLWLGAKVLILDEPTTGISQTQKEKLFAALKKLAAEGMTVFFVSHKLEDVESLCSRAAVLRQGSLAGVMDAPFDKAKLVRMMFGKEIGLAPKSRIVPGKKVLTVKTGSVDSIRLRIKDVNLEVRAGEVIGLAGMEGSGQDLFLGACGGLVEPAGGQFCLDEEERPMNGKTYHDYKKLGVAFLPAARLEKGLVPGLSLTEHYALSSATKGFFIDKAAAVGLSAERIAAFNIKGKPDSAVESLSGGNQQRALLSLLPESASLILVEHPTRGLDIESTIYIWHKLKERCSAGTAILFISSDLDEILQYSDKVLVFFAGKASPLLKTDDLCVQKLGELIGGVGWEAFKENKRA
ncbi:MAG TPA: ATP-binding cassette domain-containing protein [Rectinemataceae bacterium]|nr:ATP-binding cassette domain-containing protein [Rectinemataceae bacterium]